MKNILIPIDFSGVTEAVLAAGSAMAKAFGAQVWLIHVENPEPGFVGYEVGPAHERDRAAHLLRQEHQSLQQAEDRLHRDGVDATALLTPGDAGKKIVQEAVRLQCDLIVLGSHGRGGLHHLLVGSVCHDVLKHAPCPVLVVPAKAAK